MQSWLWDLKSIITDSYVPDVWSISSFDQWTIYFTRFSSNTESFNGKGLSRLSFIWYYLYDIYIMYAFQRFWVEPFKASISIWLTALCLCLPFWLKAEVKQRGVSSDSDKSADWNNGASCEIEWDSHLTEESCKQLWFNYNGTEEYELCDFKYQMLEDKSTLLEADCEYEKFECVSLHNCVKIFIACTWRNNYFLV